MCKKSKDGYLKQVAECMAAASCEEGEGEEEDFDFGDLLDDLESRCKKFRIEIPESAIDDASSAWDSLTDDPTSSLEAPSTMPPSTAKQPSNTNDGGKDVIIAAVYARSDIHCSNDNGGVISHCHHY
ncbi:hypothetical protein UCREL1_1671 [Eutypa lata UCREL1]|uniref:Uncharacterized protein n=1 Tax=Eutypa lata (strain UCR-EL1) TaxID=1287681 RepID=M7TMZ5_EUTLA|nr:hypothetical protein UCREL1_1671 [Eutypa lata UCREL1]